MSFLVQPCRVARRVFSSLPKNAVGDRLVRYSTPPYLVWHNKVPQTQHRAGGAHSVGRGRKNGRYRGRVELILAHKSPPNGGRSLLKHAARTRDGFYIVDADKPH
ncbi:hypothetical protein B0H12DRAFT_1144360 [Mycena haematopus]|nr:hypothetical protein B0H12DRAFT_1144360 [Mycena haematopus]